MAKITWLILFAVCLLPVFVMFAFAGAASIYKHLVTWLLSKKEEVDHEI